MVELHDAEETARDNFCSLTCEAVFATRIINRMPAMVCQIAPDGTTLRLNTAGEEVTGYRSDELIGKNWWRTFYPGEQSIQLEELVDLLQQGDVRDHEMEMTIRNGDVRTISWNSLNCYNEEGTLTEMVGFGIDITDRKQAEEALRRSQVHLEVILESTADGILAVDAVGKVIRASRTFAKLWRIPEEIIDTGDDDLILSFVLRQLVDPQEFLAKVKALYATAETDADIVFFKDGRVFERNSSPLLLEGEVIGRVWSFRDVTGRKLAEQALRESEEMYRLLTEISPSAVTVVDPSGRIAMVNRRVLELYGHEDDSGLIGRSVFDWVAPEDRDRALNALEDLLAYGKLVHLELSLVKKDGSRFWGLTNASLIRSPEGDPRLVVIVSNDLTQRKQLEEERLKVHKLESIGVLAGGIAHDFNNLLQGVFGYISLAKENLGRGEDALEPIQQAEQALKQSINLTKQLLTFAKGGQPVKKKVSLLPVIENAARFALSGARSAYSISGTGEPSTVFADEGQIGQVIQNIVMNASDAMPNGGTVDISVTRKTLMMDEHSSLPEGKYVRIDIKDTGAGIPATEVAKIFDPYFTTKQKGSGLGLATAFAITRNHGGALEVASEEGKGSTFTIHLPVDDDTAAEVEAARPSALPARKGRILVLDDEEVVRLVVTRMVCLLGHRVETAEHGELAVEMFDRARKEGDPYDIVILDLTIRGGSGGEEVVGRIRQIDPQVKAVVSSGYAESHALSDYHAYGFSAFLAKPYTVEMLRDVLNQLLV